MAAPAARVEEGKIVISGLSSAKGLSVVVAEGTEADIAARPAVSGEWAAEAAKVVFTPKYPLRPGTAYRVLGAGERLDVRVPKAERGKPTVVTHIYPSGTELPENVLRFYIEFNRPMPRGDVYKYVRVLKEDGKPDVLPFVELDNELWNADHTRLTLLIDPGRIKKEVKPRIDLGPVFRQGHKYTLVVSGKWPTLDGDPLGDEFSRAITIAPPVADGIDPKAWKLSVPAGESAALRVGFGRPLDRVVLPRSLAVIGPDGRTVPGTSEPAECETAWTFRPAAKWAAGDYVLRVDTGLEDVCGNRIGRPFEVDLLRLPPKEIKADHVDLPFTVGRR
jgi:hypothetical protein